MAMFVIKLPGGSKQDDRWLMGATAGCLWWCKGTRKARTFKTRREAQAFRREMDLDRRAPGVRVQQKFPWCLDKTEVWP